MKTIARLALLVVLMTAIPAPMAQAAWPFKSKVTRENYDKIHNGMSKDEVEAILGKPNTMKSEMEMQGLGKIESWVYMHKGIMIMVGFTSGRVSDKTWSEG
jgi:hypothetical protein